MDCIVDFNATVGAFLESRKCSVVKMPRQRQHRRQTHYLSDEKRALIVGYHSGGNTSVRETATHFNVSPGTVSKLMAKFRRLGYVKDLPKSGRPTVTTQAQVN